MRAGAEIHRTGQEVLHVVEMLDRAIVVLAEFSEGLEALANQMAAATRPHEGQS